MQAIEGESKTVIIFFRNMVIYNNDESDKALRQRNFIISVYLLPLALVLIICGAVYWASQNGYIQNSDAFYGYFMSLTPAILLSAFNRRHWLKMPDGSYHNLKGTAPVPKFNLNEPNVYDAEFFVSKMKAAGTLITGLGLIGISNWVGLNSRKTIIIPIVTNLSGLYRHISQ